MDELSYAVLRYFNVAGADPDGRVGPRKTAPTSLIDIVVESALKDEPVTIYGKDYLTADGTCIRDYIHVYDIAMGHIRALYYLRRGNESITVNLGRGSGYSVKQIIKEVENVHGSPIKSIEGGRRPGDLPCVIADNRLAKGRFDWSPEYTLHEMIKHLYTWKTKK